MLTEHQQRLREQLLAAPVVPAPPPWQRVGERPVLVGGLLGIGFAVAPDSGHDLVMVVSHAGHALLDATTGARLARERDPAPADATPDASPT